MIEVRKGMFIGWGSTLKEARECLARNIKAATAQGRRVSR